MEYSVSEQNTISRFAETQPSVRPFFQYFARLLGRAVRPIIMPYRNGAADDAVRRQRAAFLTYLLEEKENVPLFISREQKRRKMRWMDLKIPLLVQEWSL